MLVLVSPTKTQKEFKGESQSDSLFTVKSNQVLKILKSYSIKDLQKNMKLSDKLSESVYEAIQNHTKENIAIKTYKGSSFNAMEIDSWNEEDHAYAQDHLGVLSALYGIVRPFDTIGLYRLDFLNTFKLDLYDHWQDTVTDYLNSKRMPILNLASQEYTKMINEKLLEVPFVKMDFKESSDKGFVSKSTYAKIARGHATQLIIKNRIQSIDEIKLLEFDNYSYNESLSDDSNIIFTR